MKKKRPAGQRSVHRLLSSRGAEEPRPRKCSGSRNHAVGALHAEWNWNGHQHDRASRHRRRHRGREFANGQADSRRAGNRDTLPAR